MILNIITHVLDHLFSNLKTETLTIAPEKSLTNPAPMLFSVRISQVKISKYN